MFETPPRDYRLFISHAWEYSSEYQGVLKLLNADATFTWTNLSVPPDRKLPVYVELPRSYRRLVRQLDELIRQADCVLVLAAMYANHSGWIQSEVEAAVDFRKPIIPIRPRGQERIPKALTTLATTEPVGWTTGSLIAAIRRCTLPGHGQPPPTRFENTEVVSTLPRPTANELPNLNALAGLGQHQPIDGLASIIAAMFGPKK